MTSCTLIVLSFLRAMFAGSHKGDPAPVTHALLPNCTLSADRPVSIRVDMRPWDDNVAFQLLWSSNPSNAKWLAMATTGHSTRQQLQSVPPPNKQIPVPDSVLLPHVSDIEHERRTLQERASTGWNQWYRHSALAHIVLPQQVNSQDARLVMFCFKTRISNINM